jgi:hypothetical protein
MWLVKPILLFWMQWSDKLQLFLVSWLVSWKLVFLLMSSWMCLGWSTPNTSYKCIVNPNLVGIWTTSNAFIMHLEISSFSQDYGKGLTTNQILFHHIPKYIKLLEIAIVKIIESMEDEHTFNTRSFMKSKLKNRFTTHLDLVIHTFS